MPRISLSVTEIDDLINAYRSSLKKLRFEMAQINEAIESLQEMKAIKETPKEAKPAPPAQKKTATAKARPAKKKKRGRKPRKTKGYRLSDWDNQLIEVIRENNQPMASAELLDAMASRMGEVENMEQLKGKIARSLQKLANKRGVLGKASSRGRGYVYGLSDWFFARSGRLKKAYLV